MKKGKITVIFTILIACFALTCVMCMQFKIVNQTDITSIETMREDELKKELANWKEKYQGVEKQYQEVQTKIAEYKDNKKSNSETSKLVKQELNQAEILMGNTDLEGEGIEITITEAQDNDFAVIKASNLVSIINDLKYAGAEAISINEERIVTMSDIVDISETFIKVNGQRILAPYVIKAIGNKSHLESALLGTGGYAEQLTSMGHNVKITQLDKINIKKYNGQINYKYISD